MCLNKITNEIYVLNLKKRDDRLNHIKKELEKIFCENYTIVESIDGSKIENPTKLKNGMFGLIMTYLKIYELSKNNDSDSLIIIEDDCVFSKEFCEKFEIFIEEVPNDWKLLYFGGNHNTHINLEQPKKISKNVIKLINTYSAHCVIIKKDVFFKFIDELKEFKIENDVLLVNFQKKYPSYSTSEKITWQINNHSDIEEKYTNYDWLLKK
jgi:GR25 family glycosyltransferase involved in LPS biosynthesis